MKRNKLFTLVFLAMFVAAVIASTASAADTIKLKFANYFPIVHKNTVLGQQFCDEIKKRTGGRVEISYYPGGTLLTAPKIAVGVSTGIADIGMSHCGYSRGRFPVMEIMELPIGSPSAYVSTHVANDFYNKFKPKEWNEYQPLMFSVSPPAVVQTLNKPVRTLEELKAMKIRGTGRIGDLVKALGANPIPVEMVDLYESLKRNVIDGNLGPMEQLKGFQTGEVIKYVTACWKIGSSYTFYVVMNKSKWNALPDDIKNIFQETSNEFREKWAVTWNELEIEGGQFLKSQGGQIIYISDAESERWVKASQPVIGDFTKDLTDKGYSKREVDSWFAFIKERIDYWKAQEKARKVPLVYDY
ncbi:MAG TPA: TRAP transporter substrate-binding protein [Syntrophorhabdaceae bacterium]|nr:TRAP transporter substrate-binding protein [Syntrophorhabdaceae bacterium]